MKMKTKIRIIRLLEENIEKNGLKFEKQTKEAFSFISCYEIIKKHNKNDVKFYFNKNYEINMNNFLDALYDFNIENELGSWVKDDDNQLLNILNKRKERRKQVIKLLDEKKINWGYDYE